MLARIKSKVRECRLTVKPVPVRPLTAIRRRLRGKAPASRVPPSKRNSTPGTLSGQSAPLAPSKPLAEAPSANNTTRSAATVAATPAPAPATRLPYIIHKGAHYPARVVKLLNGSDALVPFGFERWRVTARGLRWPLCLNAATLDV